MGNEKKKNFFITYLLQIWDWFHVRCESVVFRHPFVKLWQMEKKLTFLAHASQRLWTFLFLNLCRWGSIDKFKFDISSFKAAAYHEQICESN